MEHAAELFWHREIVDNFLLNFLLFNRLKNVPIDLKILQNFPYILFIWKKKNVNVMCNFPELRIILNIDLERFWEKNKLVDFNW